LCPIGDPDFDGRPFDGKPVELTPSKKPEQNLAKFTKSKWESVDETELEAQGKIRQ